MLIVDRVRGAMKDPCRNSIKKAKREMLKSLDSVKALNNKNRITYVLEINVFFIILLM